MKHLTVARLSRQLLIVCAGLGLSAGVYATSAASSSEAPTTSQASAAAAAEVALPKLEVFKSPTCGCCREWVTHAEQAGFPTQVNESANLNAVKQKLGIEPRYQSCHTAVSEEGGYFFEGHVPAKVIQRFLQEKPAQAAGLAVPGMPLGSPGMEMGDRFQPYQVWQINKDGTSEVYADISSPLEQY